MRNFRLSVCVAVVAAGFAMSLAQGPGGPGGMRGPGGPGGGFAAMRKMMEAREDAIFTKIHVTPGQKKKILALRAEINAKREAMMKGGGRPDRSKMVALRDERDLKLSHILSKDQFTQYKTLRMQMMPRMGGRGGPGGPGGRPGGPGRA